MFLSTEPEHAIVQISKYISLLTHGVNMWWKCQWSSAVVQPVDIAVVLLILFGRWFLLQFGFEHGQKNSLAMSRKIKQIYYYYLSIEFHQIFFTSWHHKFPLFLFPCKFLRTALSFWKGLFRHATFSILASYILREFWGIYSFGGLYGLVDCMVWLIFGIFLLLLCRVFLFGWFYVCFCLLSKDRFRTSK